MQSSFLLREVILLLVSAAAGAVNAVAGGGTLLTFPTLIGLGESALVANATSTVGLVPGSLGGAWGYRRELTDSTKWLRWLLPSSLAGGLVGAILLVLTPPIVFARLAPLLVLFATLLFILQEVIRSRMDQSIGPARPWLVAGCQFLIAIYGGYFGAGMGIVMLAALGLLRLGNIHRMNGLKSIAAACVNGIASLLFLMNGIVRWHESLAVAIGSTLGGYFAADTARKLGQKTIRRIVVAIGLGTSVVLAFKG